MAQAEGGPAAVTPAAAPGGPYKVVVKGTGFSGDLQIERRDESAAASLSSG